MLEEWSRTKKAPRHADWLHEMAAEANGAASNGTSADVGAELAERQDRDHHRFDDHRREGGLQRAVDDRLTARPTMAIENSSGTSSGVARRRPASAKVAAAMKKAVMSARIVASPGLVVQVGRRRVDEVTPAPG